MKPITRDAAEHYVWGQMCDGWHLVKDASLSVIQERMPAGASEACHFHQRAQQFFFILAGEAVMQVAEEQTILRAGEGLHIPQGTAHQIANSSPAPLEFLVISHPPSHGDRVNQ